MSKEEQDAQLATMTPDQQEHILKSTPGSGVA
jgi:hypothetical protein